MSKKIRTTILIDEGLFKLAKAHAVKHNTSFSGLIQIILKDLPSEITTRMDNTMKVSSSASGKTASEIEANFTETLKERKKQSSVHKA